MNLTEQLLKGDRKALAKLITLVENRKEGYQRILDRVYSYTGNSFRVGITGPPGVGKSTLTDKLASVYLEKGQQVGILACDPTSPFTHGALLGDRVRMRKLSMKEGIFIRSLATKGKLGGLSLAVPEAILLLEAYGVDLVLLETVGTGQAEVEVAGAADCTLLVLAPQSGDYIQALKAGLMEIADIIVVNKCDQEGADSTVQQLRSILELSNCKWEPPVAKTVAHQDKGTRELVKEVGTHRKFLLEGNRLETYRKQRAQDFVKRIVKEKFMDRFWRNKAKKLLDQRLKDIPLEDMKPYQAAEDMINNFVSTFTELD